MKVPRDPKARLRVTSKAYQRFVARRELEREERAWREAEALIRRVAISSRASFMAGRARRKKRAS